MELELGENHFGYVDYIVVGGTLALSLGIGIYHSLRSRNVEEFLVGGRHMGPLPVAASMLVTYLSAITLLGYPSEIYYYGIQITMMTIMNVIFVPIGTYFLVPFFYNLKLTSVYKYLEYRFKSKLLRWLASFTFIVQVVVLSGVVLFAPSIAMQHILGLPLMFSILGIGICATVYTTMGGFKAVIWTDVFQLIMILIGMITIVVKGFITSGGIGNAFKIAHENGRLNLFDFTFDPFMRHNTLNFVFGFGFAIIALTCTHQPQVQRYSSLPSLELAQRAVLLSIPMNVVTMSLIAFTGISIFATYHSCDPFTSKKVSLKDEIVPYFVVQELAFIPGLLGLFISCIFSAVLSTLSSTLNSLSAVTWDDFMADYGYFKKLTEGKKANVTRLLSVFYGGIIIVFAFSVKGLGSILPLTIAIAGATSGPLAGIFVVALFLPCNKWGGIAGMSTSLCFMMWFAYEAFQIGAKHPTLITKVDGCPDLIPFVEEAVQPELTWPTKIFTLSYLLYAFMGILITVVISLIVSLLTGGFCEKIDQNLIHPCLKKSLFADSNREMKHKAKVLKSSRVGHADRLTREFSFPQESCKSYTYTSYNNEQQMPMIQTPRLYA